MVTYELLDLANIHNYTGGFTSVLVVMSFKSLS